MIEYLYEFVAAHDMISCIEYDYVKHMEFLKRDFPNLTGLDEYSFEFLGVRNPTREETQDPEKINEYCNYIFSNQFFTDIIDVI